MRQDKYYFKISPESLSEDIFEETLSGVTFGIYSAMPDRDWET